MKHFVVPTGRSCGPIRAEGGGGAKGGREAGESQGGGEKGGILGIHWGKGVHPCAELTPVYQTPARRAHRQHKLYYPTGA